MKFLKALICVFILGAFATSLPAAGPNWPVFHGPGGDNKSPDTGLLEKWPEGGPKLLWTADFIGFGYSGVSIAEGRIYISGNVEEDGKVLSMVFCLDPEGNLLWKNDNGPAHADPRRYPSTRSTPTIDGEFVYDESPLGEVACFEAKTGRKIWNRNILEDFEGSLPRWALSESVVIDGEKLICAPGGRKTSVVALDKRTGKTLWEAAPSDLLAGFATPYFFEFDGLRVVAIITAESIIALDPEDGFVRFTFPLKNNRTTNVTMPIYRDGHLFLTTGYGEGSRLLKLEKDGRRIVPREEWYEKRFDNHHGGVLLIGDYVYGTTHNGFWGSIHFGTGKIGYLERGIGAGSVHYADGMIYGLSENNKTVILLKPNPEKYEEISRFELPNEAEGKSWAHPVVLDGRLYLRHAQYLYCFDVAGEAN